MKILNLYAGIGGSRKLWGDEHEVTAIELDDKTADVYQHFYPNDTVVRADAHQYLLDHYKEFDFIWSSPPCPTHSRLNTALHPKGVVRYPDMSLWQEIIYLKQWGKNLKWCVENVIPYYKPLVAPTVEIERHLFWSNFEIADLELPSLGTLIGGGTPPDVDELQDKLGITLPDFAITVTARRKMLRDITRPEIGEHILRCAVEALEPAYA